VIDPSGYRLNVGIILTNNAGQLFWGRRVRQEAWQFPQGGVNLNESLEQALFRELFEEIGLQAQDVEIIRQTKNWLSYRLPKRLVRSDSKPVCIGQKQKWFLLRLISQDQQIQLDSTPKPEFDAWQWVNYWYPLHQVVMFKKEVYRQALSEFAPWVISRPVIKKIKLDPIGE
jgi:putative (di)nucleoside polyphosphate hydrolase